MNMAFKLVVLHYILNLIRRRTRGSISNYDSIVNIDVVIYVCDIIRVSINK